MGKMLRLVKQDRTDRSANKKACLWPTSLNKKFGCMPTNYEATRVGLDVLCTSSASAPAAVFGVTAALNIATSGATITTHDDATTKIEMFFDNIEPRILNLICGKLSQRIDVIEIVVRRN